MRVGFIGLGVMGAPMALNLSRKFPLTVWNRSISKYPILKEAGASVVGTPTEVAEQSGIIFLMLFNEAAIQSILNVKFKQALLGKTLINAGSVSVGFSISLAEHVRVAGGDFIEMPVSGSKVPAEQRQLVGLLAGDPKVAERIKACVKPVTRAAIFCGPIGSGLKAKYAINTLAITTTVGLAKSTRAQGLDLSVFGQILDNCPMVSDYSKLKVEKILKGDWTPQAGVRDCFNSTKLIQDAAASVNARSPLMQVCGELYGEATTAGLGKEDMISVLKIIAKSSV